MIFVLAGHIFNLSLKSRWAPQCTIFRPPNNITDLNIDSTTNCFEHELAQNVKGQYRLNTINKSTKMNNRHFFGTQTTSNTFKSDSFHELFWTIEFYETSDRFWGPQSQDHVLLTLCDTSEWTSLPLLRTSVQSRIPCPAHVLLMNFPKQSVSLIGSWRLIEFPLVCLVYFSSSEC